jgi:acyl-ACP thioesterase
MNEIGVASPSSMLTFLEETAAKHSHSINKSLYQLAQQNRGWVLVSGVIKMERYPRYKEKITIRTWLSNYSIIKGTGENIIDDEQNTIIGRAKGLWVFFDIDKRRPTPILDEIKEKWYFCSETSVNTNISKKIAAVEHPDYELKFKINGYNTDINKHLNNIRYLQWLVETVPDEISDEHYLF